MSDKPVFAEYNEPKKGRYAKDTYSIIGDAETVARTVSGTNEVVVKIASTANGTSSVNGMVDYMGRIDSESKRTGREPVTLEDEQGNRFIGEHARTDSLMTWQSLDVGRGDRREAFQIVFSMPEGTPANAVREAASAFAKTEFQRFQYVFAQHDDTDNPHVHMIVHATPYISGKRLAPSPQDLRRWREVFAENLRERGVEANATPRAARLVMDYAKTRSVLHRDREAAHSAEISNRRQAEYVNIDALTERVKRVYTEYMDMAESLSKGDEKQKQLSENITGWLYSRTNQKAEQLEL